MLKDVRADRVGEGTIAKGQVVRIGHHEWPIDHQVVYGNPTNQDEWTAKLDPLIRTVYRHVNGAWIA